MWHNISLFEKKAGEKPEREFASLQLKRQKPFQPKAETILSLLKTS
jgi:hypothetical protein